MNYAKVSLCVFSRFTPFSCQVKRVTDMPFDWLMSVVLMVWIQGFSSYNFSTNWRTMPEREVC